MAIVNSLRLNENIIPENISILGIQFSISEIPPVHYDMTDSSDTSSDDETSYDESERSSLVDLDREVRVNQLIEWLREGYVSSGYSSD